MLKEIRPAVVSFLLLTLLTGIAYPLVVTGIAQGLMPGKANGYPESRIAMKSAGVNLDMGGVGDKLDASFEKF